MSEFNAGRSLLDELQDAISHAKSVTIDDIFSILGSANMDQHSFRLNYEERVGTAVKRQGISLRQ